MANVDQIKALNRRQGTIKARITSLENFMASASLPIAPPNEGDDEAKADFTAAIATKVSAIRLRLEANQTTLKEFEELHNQIIEIEDENALQKRYDEFTLFEDRYHTVVTSATVLLDRLNLEISPLSNSSSFSIAADNGESNIVVTRAIIEGAAAPPAANVNNAQIQSGSQVLFSNIAPQNIEPPPTISNAPPPSQSQSHFQIEQAS